MTTGFDGSTYSYDAQNRLINATKGGSIETFKYDALNRQVKRTINGAAFYSIWDGWNLIINYNAYNGWTNSYWHGPGGMLAEMNGTTWVMYFCYADASGSTTHLADGTSGALLEWYRYDLQGTPIFYNASNTQISASAYDIRHYLTGQQWDSALGLYDLRNRFYSPDIGRFLQPDPIGFNGDATNLYRYCGNNPINTSDPTGLDSYYGYKVIGTPIAVSAGTPFMYFYSHEFVFTTNSGGTLAHTYGWGETSAWGTWSRDSTYDKAAANWLISNGGAVWVGGPEMDAYVQDAYDQVSQEPGHYNGIISNNCYTEAHHLVDTASDAMAASSEQEESSTGGENARSRGANYYPNATGGYAPGAYAFAWGDAPWAYGQNPYGAWGNEGNYNISQESRQFREQGLAFAGNLAGQGLGLGLEPMDFEGRRGPLGSWAAIMNGGNGSANGSWPVRGR